MCPPARLGHRHAPDVSRLGVLLCPGLLLVCVPVCCVQCGGAQALVLCSAPVTLVGIRAGAFFTDDAIDPVAETFRVSDAVLGLVAEWVPFFLLMMPLAPWPRQFVLVMPSLALWPSPWLRGRGSERSPVVFKHQHVCLPTAACKPPSTHGCIFSMFM